MRFGAPLLVILVCLVVKSKKNNHQEHQEHQAHQALPIRVATDVLAPYGRSAIRLTNLGKVRPWATRENTTTA